MPAAAPMPERASRRSAGQRLKSVWKREPNSEYQTEQSKHRGHQGPAHSA